MSVFNIKLDPEDSVAFVGDIHVDSTPPNSRIDVDYVQTCVDKLEQIRVKCLEYNVKVLIFSGDIFNSIGVVNEVVNRVGKVLQAFTTSGIALFTIYGNHDIPRNQHEAALMKSPLSLLTNFGVINHLDIDSKLVINGKAVITGVDYYKDIPVVDNNADVNICVAHYYYNVPLFGGSYNLEPSQVEALGYDMIYLGHDHQPYVEEYVGKTTIFRTGSILRGSVHDYNFQRDVGFLVVRDICNYNPDNCKVVYIEIKPFSQIVSQKVINDKVSLFNIDDVFKSLVDKISESTSGGNLGKGRSIIDKVKNNSNLPEGVRLMLLHYFQQEGISC